MGTRVRDRGKLQELKFLKNSFFDLKIPFPHSLYYFVQFTPVLVFHSNYFAFEKFQDSYKLFYFPPTLPLP